MAHARVRNRTGIRTKTAVQPKAARTLLLGAMLGLAAFAIGLGVVSLNATAPGGAKVYATASVALWLALPAASAAFIARPWQRFRDWATLTALAGLGWALAGAIHATYFDDVLDGGSNVFPVMFVMLALPQLLLIGGTGMLVRSLRRARALKSA